MNDKLRKRLIDGINVMSNPIMIVVVVAIMLVCGFWAMDEITPLLWIIAGACLLLSVIGGQLAKCGSK